MTAIALTIAGSDSGGGAGIQADLKTFAALGVYGASAITALTAQNTLGVDAVLAVPPDFVRAQMWAIARDLEVRAIKIGMLANASIIGAVADGLADFPGVPVVLDPVMVAASGDVLLDEDAVETLRARFLPIATLITPNLAEAAFLLGASEAHNEQDMEQQGTELLATGARAVLIKGGHLRGEQSVDLLVTADRVERFAAPRIETRNTHGTGCTLSSAIAAELAKGAPLRAAVARGKIFVTEALKHADELSIGKGRGPVHHLHEWWPGSK